jgi:Coenzyme PQQ synthesis protein D (PqqD)
MRTSQPRNVLRLKPALRPAVRYRPEREGAVVFDTARLGIYATNRTGLMILKRVNGRTSCGELLEELSRRFTSASRRILKRDLGRFLEELEDAGLLEFTG